MIVSGETITPATAELAVELQSAISLLVRRLKAERLPGELTAPEQTALSRLQRFGPATSAELARAERMTPQSMGSTLGSLEARGLVERSRDPHDGRRILLAATAEGLDHVASKRSARAAQLAGALATFDDTERGQLAAVLPLLERLAHQL
jgi:DNA-binding MarR family transcriptional regulator